MLTGKQFNERYKGCKFVKLTNITETHYGLKYKTGRNVDNNKIDDEGYGIHFCLYDDVYKWINMKDFSMIFFRFVTVPDDATVYEGNYMFRSNVVDLSDRKFIEAMDVWYDDHFCKIATSYIPSLVRYVKAGKKIDNYYYA